MRVLIAEDSVFVREGLARILERRGFDVVGEAACARRTIRSAR